MKLKLTKIVIAILTSLLAYACEDETVKMLKVTFDFLGLKPAVEVPVVHGKAAVAPTDTKIDGLNFKGWDKDFSLVEEDLTVKAIYTANVKFMYGNKDEDGKHQKEVAQEVIYGEDAVPPSAEEVKVEGKTFKHWSEDFSNVTHHMTVKAVYEVDTFSVVFKYGANLEFDTVVVVDYNTSASAPTNIDVVGKTFKGWDAEFDNVVTDLEIHALYEVNTYNVTFKNGDGTILKEEVVDYGNGATAPENPVMEGKTFKGWDVKFDNIVSDMTINAIYDINTYNVTFDFGGLKDNVVVKNVEYGSSIEAPTSTDVTGKTFKGWSSDEYTSVKSDLNIKALYDVNIYTVTFDFGGLKDNVTMNVEYGKSATAPKDIDVIGKTFKGWNATFDNITSNTVVKAIYEINTYTVTFDFGGLKDNVTMNVEYGKSATAPTNVEVTGKTFKGWNATFDNITSNTVVKAIYTVNTYTVKFFNADGTLLKSMTVEYGSDAIAPANPVKPSDVEHDYSFNGWSLDYTVVESDMEVYATYMSTPRKYEVEFVDINGNTLKKESVEYGMGCAAPNAPEVEGKTFKGWSNDGYKNVTGNVKTIATYEVNVYEVKFMADGVVVATENVEHGKSATAPTADKEGYTMTWKGNYTNVTKNEVVEAVYTAIPDTEVSVKFVGYNEGTKVVKFAWNEWNEEEEISDDAILEKLGNLEVEGYTWKYENGVVTYTINTFKVTFDFGGIRENVVVEVEYGKSAVAPSDVEVEGYTFDGWNGKFENVTSDNVVYAKYTAWTITISDKDAEGKVTVTPNADCKYVCFNIDRDYYNSENLKDVNNLIKCIKEYYSEKENIKEGIETFSPLDSEVTIAFYTKVSTIDELSTDKIIGSVVKK